MYSGQYLHMICLRIGCSTNATLGATALHCIKLCSICQKNLLAVGKEVFQRNKSFRICEIAFGGEIWLRHVKCLRAWVDLFHFTFCVSRKFHNDWRHYFTFAVRQIFHELRLATSIVSNKHKYDKFLLGLVVFPFWLDSNLLRYSDFWRSGTKVSDFFISSLENKIFLFYNIAKVMPL